MAAFTHTCQNLIKYKNWSLLKSVFRINSLFYVTSTEKPVLNKKNHPDLLVLSFGDATTIQSTALRGHPVPHFKWFQQPIRICNSGCKPDARKWRRVPRHAIDPSEKVPSRISSLFLPPAKSGYFFRCIAENSLGHDDAVFSVHRVGKFIRIDTNFTEIEFLTCRCFFCPAFYT